MLFQIKHKIGISFILVFVWGFFNGVLAQEPVQLGPPPVDSTVVDSNKVIDKFKQIGVASYYGAKFHGRRTASGEKYSRHKLTAAHNTLPFGCMVKVTDVKTGKWVIVRINDRGPYHPKRIIDLSYEAARQMGMTKGKGIMKVKIRVVEWPQ
jgi:rare lipoprotein A